MHGEPHRTTTWRSAALGVAACASLILSGCGGAAPEVTLPADRVESAGLCYGATMALTQEKVGTGSVPLDAASHALHFALLAGTAGDLDDPAKAVGKRSAERRVGKAWGSTGRSWWSPYNSKKQK